ncbi:MAG TPA: hypothetical protein VGN20_19265 [Mucilaginibacter sp.]|jgi:redox-regulated HSP33 family molecular chaperone
MKLNPKNNILKGEAPEIGNPTQIKKLQDHERYENEFYEWGIELRDHKHVKCSARFQIYFTCAECGNPDVNIEIEMDSITESEMAIDDSDNNGKCNFCNTEYEFEDGLIQVVKNPLHPEKLNKEDAA